MGSRIIQELQESPVQEALPFLIKLSENVRDAVTESRSFQSECAEVGKRVDGITQMLRSAVRISASPSLYDRPLRRVTAEVSQRVFRAASLLRKCKGRNVLRRLFTIVTQADFRRVQGLLAASITDLKWVLRILDSDAAVDGDYGGGIISLPPIASNDPILAWVWSSVASIHMSTQLIDRIDGANSLISLAQDSERNKKIIAEEGGIPPLLKLLKEKSSSPDAQIAAAIALLQLATTQERVKLIAENAGIQIVVQVLGDSPIRVQLHVAQLVAKMAELDPASQEGFAKESVIRPLVSSLALEYYPLEDEPKSQCIGSIVEINTKNRYQKPNMSSSSSSSLYSDGIGIGMSRRGHRRRNTWNENPEVIHKLKLSCSRALWMLASGSVPNSTRITETIGLLYLAKTLEKESGELQFNCLMTISEIASAAESNSDLRRAAFKTNSPAAKAVVEQLLRIVKESESPLLAATAIGAIGSLSRTFPARETRVVIPLVEQLSNKDRSMATEAAIALGKFACPDNFLCMEHSKTIIQFNGVPPLMRLLSDERTQFPGLTLVCYLALHAGSSDALEEAKVLTNLEVAEKIVSPRYPELKELVRKAIAQLSLYRAGVEPIDQPFDMPFGRFAIEN